MSEPVCNNILTLINCEDSYIYAIVELLSTKATKIVSAIVRPKLVRILFDTLWISPNSIIKTISSLFPQIILLLEGISPSFITQTIHKEGKLIDLDTMYIGSEGKKIFTNYQEYLNERGS